MTRAPTRSCTDATAALAGAAWRRLAWFEMPLSIVGIESISFTSDGSRFPALRVPKCKPDEPNDRKSTKDDQHGEVVYGRAWLPSTLAHALTRPVESSAKV